MTTPETPTSVGQQLRARREALNLTQVALAQLIGIEPTSVSGTERDRSTIRRGKRASWERALSLVPGTITRAYQDGTPIETIDDAGPDVHADLADPFERAAWALDLPAAQKRLLIDLHRATLATAPRQRRRSA